MKVQWQVTDPVMENMMAALPRKPMTPIAELSGGLGRRKVGRNAPCPCGSALKYKKCCLKI